MLSDEQSPNIANISELCAGLMNIFIEVLCLYTDSQIMLHVGTVPVEGF